MRIDYGTVAPEGYKTLLAMYGYLKHTALPASYTTYCLFKSIANQWLPLLHRFTLERRHQQWGRRT